MRPRKAISKPWRAATSLTRNPVGDKPTVSGAISFFQASSSGISGRARASSSPPRLFGNPA